MNFNTQKKTDINSDIFRGVVLRFIVQKNRLQASELKMATKKAALLNPTYFLDYKKWE